MEYEGLMSNNTCRSKVYIYYYYNNMQLIKQSNNKAVNKICWAKVEESSRLNFKKIIILHFASILIVFSLFLNILLVSYWVFYLLYYILYAIVIEKNPLESFLIIIIIIHTSIYMNLNDIDWAKFFI